MSRELLPSVKDVAQQVLHSMEIEQFVKTAEQQMLNDALHPTITTDEGFELRKLAECCRMVDDDNPSPTYEDLLRFVRQCHAR